MRRRRTIVAVPLALLAVLAVATAVAQVAPPANGEADASTTDGGAASEPEPADVGAAEPDAMAGEAGAAADAGVAPPQSFATIAPTGSDGGDARSDVTRVVSRRREAALVGGWVHSQLAADAGTVAVDDLNLGANGEWLRRAGAIDDADGLAATPDETSGAWFTEGGELVLLARGSAVSEVLRAAYQIDDRSERLVLELPGGPSTFFRYR